MRLTVLLAVPSASKWSLKSALENVSVNVEAIDDLAKGLRATTSTFDVAVLDGATKSLTLNWANAELKKRNPNVRIFTAPLEQSPDAFARQLTGTPEKQRDFEETSDRLEYSPLFLVDGVLKGAPRWIVGGLDGETIDPLLAIASSLAAVSPSSALWPLVEFGRDEARGVLARFAGPVESALAELRSVRERLRTLLA